MCADEGVNEEALEFQSGAVEQIHCCRKKWFLRNFWKKEEEKSSA